VLNRKVTAILHATSHIQTRCGAFKKNMNIIQNIAKWTTIWFFLIVLFSLTIAQIIPIEFADWRIMHKFYEIIIEGLPIAVLLTLIWTLKKSNSKKRNIITGILTFITAIIVCFSSIFLVFSYGFGAWINYEIVYEHKEYPEQTINEQIYDIGAFGYGGKRIVELKPFLKYWQKVQPIDTTKIETKNWIRVEKEGDIKFP
jgi:uncharacterized membrane protein